MKRRDYSISCAREYSRRAAKNDALLIKYQYHIPLDLHRFIKGEYLTEYECNKFTIVL